MTTPAATPVVVEAERAVLAAMLLERGAIARARIISAEAFHLVPHRLIFKAILTLEDRDEPADLVTLADELRAQGKLEEAGGMSLLSGILDMATTTANLEAHLRAVRLAHAKRRAIRAAAEMSESVSNGGHHGMTPSELIASVGVRLTEIARDAEPGPRPPTLEDQTVSDVELFEKEIAAPKDLIGGRYVTAGGLTVIASLPGMGKTFLMIQAMRSLATGEPWLDYEVAEARSFMVQLEMTDFETRDRLQGTRERLQGRTDWLIMPEGFGYISESSTVDQISSIVDRRKIEFLVMDPVGDAFQGNINFDEEIVPSLSAVHLIRRRTGVHICLIHHINKLEWDNHASMRTNVLRSFKGSGRLTKDATVCLGLIERHGRLLLVNAKTRLGPSEEAVAIRQDPASGWFHRVQSESEVAQASENKLEACLRYHGRQGASMEQITDECGMSRSTAQRHLAEMDVAKVGGGSGTGGRANAARYFLREFSPQVEGLAGQNSQNFDGEQSDEF